MNPFRARAEEAEEAAEARFLDGIRELLSRAEFPSEASLRRLASPLAPRSILLCLLPLLSAPSLRDHLDARAPVGSEGTPPPARHDLLWEKKLSLGLQRLLESQLLGDEAQGIPRLCWASCACCRDATGCTPNPSDSHPSTVQSSSHGADSDPGVESGPGMANGPRMASDHGMDSGPGSEREQRGESGGGGEGGGSVEGWGRVREVSGERGGSEMDPLELLRIEDSAQLLASVPDRVASLDGPQALRGGPFAEAATTQLLSALVSATHIVADTRRRRCPGLSVKKGSPAVEMEKDGPAVGLEKGAEGEEGVQGRWDLGDWGSVAGTVHVLGPHACGATAFAAQTMLRFCRRGHADAVAQAFLNTCLNPLGALKSGTSGHESGKGLTSDAGLKLDTGLEGGHRDTGEVVHDNLQGPSNVGSGKKTQTGVQPGEVLRGVLPRLVRQLAGDAAALERFVQAFLVGMDKRGVGRDEGKRVVEMVFGASDLPPNLNFLLSDVLLTRKILSLRCLTWAIHLLTSAASLEARARALEASVALWSAHEFVQCASTVQQISVSAAVGMLLLAVPGAIHSSPPVLPGVLQGISVRLGSPLPEARLCGQRVARAFSVAASPGQDPLSFEEFPFEGAPDPLDWERGWELEALTKGALKGVDRGPEGGEGGRGERGDGGLGEGEGGAQGRREEDVGGREAGGGGREGEGGNEGERQGEVERGQGVRMEGFNVASKQEAAAKAEPLRGPGTTEPLSMKREAEKGDREGEGEEEIEEEEEEEFAPLPGTEEGRETGGSGVCQGLDVEDFKYLRPLRAWAADLRDTQNPDKILEALDVVYHLVCAQPDELEDVAAELARSLVYLQPPSLAVEGEESTVEWQRQRALVALLVCATTPTLHVLTKELFSASIDVGQRLMVLDVLSGGAKEIAAANAPSLNSGPSTTQPQNPPSRRKGPLIQELTSSFASSSLLSTAGPRYADAAAPWEEMGPTLPWARGSADPSGPSAAASPSSSGSLLEATEAGEATQRYVRTLPSKSPQVGKIVRRRCRTAVGAAGENSTVSSQGLSEQGASSDRDASGGLQGSSDRLPGYSDSTGARAGSGSGAPVARSLPLPRPGAVPRFADVAPGFMLPVMRHFDRVSQGVDWVNRDYVVLGRVLLFLGQCVALAAPHPETGPLAAAFFGIASSSAVSRHPEPYVRRCALLAATPILRSLPVPLAQSALEEAAAMGSDAGAGAARGGVKVGGGGLGDMGGAWGGGGEVTGLGEGLVWVREWAQGIAWADEDEQTGLVAFQCLAAHQELCSHVLSARRVDASHILLEKPTVGVTQLAHSGSSAKPKPKITLL